MNFCANPDCFNELTRGQKKFCSHTCHGLALRGSGKSHIRVRINGERFYLHRLIYEENFRPLEPGEVVHHKDGNKHNNDPENLEALTQAEHLAAHDFWRNRGAIHFAPLPDIEVYDPAFGW